MTRLKAKPKVNVSFETECLSENINVVGDNFTSFCMSVTETELGK